MLYENSMEAEALADKQHVRGYQQGVQALMACLLPQLSHMFPHKQLPTVCWGVGRGEALL